LILFITFDIDRQTVTDGVSMNKQHEHGAERSKDMCAYNPGADPRGGVPGARPPPLLPEGKK